MTEVKRYHLTETGLVEGESLGRLSVVLAADFDTLQSRLDDTERQRRAEFDASQAAERLVAELQQRLTAADEELAQCQSMALMIEEKEWAEHVGKGPISSQVESSFTQLHNELSEAHQGLTAADERLVQMSKLLQRCIPVCRFKGSHTERALINEIEAALKPAEGGGDEA